MTETEDITEILVAARRGDSDAVNRLVARVHPELRKLARRQLGFRNPAQTLDTAGLIGELYLRLVDQSRVDVRDRRHFFAYAAKAMRDIVIDRARRNLSRKRGGDLQRVGLEGLDVGLPGRAEDALALDQALTRLQKANQRQGRLVELRFFAGMDFREAAEVLEVSEETARRDWKKARAFLYHVLEGPAAPS